MWPCCADKLCASKLQDLEIDFAKECMDHNRWACLQP